MTKPTLKDELCHYDEDFKLRSLSEVISDQSECDVVLHNTMRFDVQLAYFYEIADEVDAKQLADAIARAIVDVVNEKTGGGFAGQCHMVEAKSVMLHRETISFDFS